jgi:hypothetical protein
MGEAMPRKPKTETHRGVDQKLKGSDIWWVRWVDIKGTRRAVRAGNFGTAVKLSDESRLAMADVHLERVSELAAHKTLGVTRRYAHLAPQKLQEALERLVSPGALPAGDGARLEALRRLARNGSLLDALQPAKTAGTIPVQNGSLAQNVIHGQGQYVAVSRSYQPTY